MIIRDENLFTEKATLEKAAGEIIAKKPLWIGIYLNKTNIINKYYFLVINNN